MKTVIGYVRVSTKRQGESGLGLEAQRSAIEDFCKSHNAILEQVYTEVESGRRSDRPKLAKAIAHARRNMATILVAKLDRLARNVHFLSTLMESKVDFKACDMPEANRFMLHVMMALAEQEREMISKRTKDALAAYKARGHKLGSARPHHWKGKEHRRLIGAINGGRVTALKASRYYGVFLPDILRYRSERLTLQEICAKLNEQGHVTRRGFPWRPMQVCRVLKRVSAKLLNGG